MKKITSSLVALLCLALFSCEQAQQVVENNVNDLPLQGISSVEDFQKLVDADVAPIDQLSEQTIAKFKEELLFDETGTLLSARYLDVHKELSENDQAAFWLLIFGEETTWVDSEEELTETDINAIESRGSCKWIITPNARKVFWGGTYQCWYEIGQICAICYPNEQ